MEKGHRVWLDDLAYASTPGGIRTPNIQFRRLTLYPIELRALNKKTSRVWREVHLVGRVKRFELSIFWATTRRVNHYTTPAMNESECYHKLGVGAIKLKEQKTGNGKLNTEEWRLDEVRKLETAY